MTVMPIEVIYGEVVDMLSYEGAGLTDFEKQKQEAYKLMKVTPETSTGSQGYGEE
jgi:hypothetical protein